MPDLSIKSFVMCEDVREEKTGKLIIIGVYTGSIIVADDTTFPLQMRLAFFFQTTGSHEKEAQYRLSIKRPNNKDIIDVRFDGSSGDGSYAVLEFESFPFFETGSHTLSLMWEDELIFRTTIGVQKRSELLPA